MQALFPLVTATLACWYVSSSLWVYPHSLSYFNESIGGPMNGPEHLLGSSVDWGQDLRYIRWLYNNELRKKTLRLAYYGYFSPASLGFEETLPSDYESAFTNNTKTPEQIAEARTAVSVSLLYGFPYIAQDGRSRPMRMTTAACQSFKNKTPWNYVGYSVLVYK